MSDFFILLGFILLFVSDIINYSWIIRFLHDLEELKQKFD